MAPRTPFFRGSGRFGSGSLGLSASRYHQMALEILKDLFRGYPAIIVSAGPSLAKNIDRLHEAKGRAVIIAVQTVFKPLLANPSLVPIVEMRLGEKAMKMIYSGGGISIANVPTSELERASFVLADEDILTLARWACFIEDHYGCPMDIEWCSTFMQLKDTSTGR